MHIIIVEIGRQEELMMCETAKRAEKVKLLEGAIQAIAQHPTLDKNAKNRGIQPLKMALIRLAKDA
ncbi:MAG: hypothetical protein GX063_03125 [Firmicutes bacterium]|nr:hypothetical protein [Bacillota bacterium]